MLTVSDPVFLLLLLAILPVWWIAAHSSTALTKPQAVSSLILRMAIVALLALAAAGPQWRTSRSDTAVLVLADTSPSITSDGMIRMREKLADLDRAGSRERLAVAAFARELRLVAPFDVADKSIPPDLSPIPETNLTAALESAGALLPGERPGRVVVLTDGHFADPEAAIGAAARMRARGVPLDVIALHPERGAEVEIASIEVPTQLQPREAFDATVSIRAAQDGPATLRIFQDEVLGAERELSLKAGESRHTIRNLTASEGASDLRAEIAAPGDPSTANNQRDARTVASGGSRLLLLDPEPAALQPIADLLQAEGFEVELRRPATAPDSIEELRRYDFVLLSDTSADDLGDARMRKLRHWVSDFGGGLLIAGGERSFASGGYFQTPLAELAPVRIEYADTAELPVVALLVVLDRSGSMTAPVGGQTKMALADQGVVRAMDVLQPKDLFGVLAVDTQVHPVLPLGRIAEKSVASKRILGIDAGGGGIYIFTALGAAYRTLADASARIKHVIVFSDAADAEEKIAGEMGPSAESGASSLDLATAMLSKRITVSVVALGSESDRDTSFLRNLAARGGGRFYLTSDAMSLPRIFAQETLRATRANLVEEAFQAKAATPGEETQGIDWADAPFLLGYNATQPRSAASLLLTTETGEPLLARWRFGLGQVAAFTSDLKGRWSADWLAWPGFGKLLTQTLRTLVRRDDHAGLTVRALDQNGKLIVDAEAIDAAGAFRNGLPIAVSLTSDQAKSESRMARQIGPGHYRAEFPLAGKSGGVVAVSDGGDAPPVLAAWTRSGEGEFAVLGDTAPVLGRLAAAGGGKFNPAPADVFRPTGRAVTTSMDLSIYLLAIALVLIPIDIWLRRRNWA